MVTGCQTGRNLVAEVQIHFCSSIQEYRRRLDANIDRTTVQSFKFRSKIIEIENTRVRVMIIAANDSLVKLPAPIPDEALFIRD
jgi:hypothetical protein